MNTRVLMASCVAMLLGLGASTASAQPALINPPAGISLGGLPRDKFPPYEWWQNTTWTDPAPNAWTVIDITSNNLGAGKSITPNDDTLDVSPVIKAIVNATKGTYRIIRLPAGTYYAHTTLSIDDDNVWIQGVGRSDPNTTKIVCTGKGDGSYTAAAKISVRGSTNNTSGITANAPLAGDDTIVVNDATLLSQNAYINVRQPARGYFQKLCRVTGITPLSGGGASVQLDRRMSYDYDPAVPTVVDVLRPRVNVRLEKFVFERASTATSTDANFDLTYAANISLNEITSNSALSAHVGLWQAQDVNISNSIFRFSRHYGVGGSGYGVSFGSGVTRTRVNNCAFYNLRHSIVFQYYANFNVVTGCFLRSDQGHRDDRFHDNDPYANLLEGNDGLGMLADNAHGGDTNNGPYNTVFRNRANTANAGANNAFAASPFVVVGNVVADSATGHFAQGNVVAGTPVWINNTPVTLPNSLVRPNATAASAPFGPDRVNYGNDIDLTPKGWVLPATYQGGVADVVNVNATATLAAPQPLPTFAKWPVSVPAGETDAPYVPVSVSSGSTGGPVQVAARYYAGTPYDPGAAVGADRTNGKAVTTTDDDDRLYLLVTNSTGFSRRVVVNYTQPIPFRRMVRGEMYFGARSTANASNTWLDTTPVIKTDMTTASDYVLDQEFVVEANKTLFIEFRRNDNTSAR